MAVVAACFDRKGDRIGGSMPVTDRGVRYGMSVFETAAWTGGRLLFVDEHLGGLRQAAGAAEIVFPEFLGREWVERFVQECDGAGVLRIYLTAGDGGALAPANEPRVMVLFEEAAFPTAEETARGYRAVTVAAPVPCILGGWKTGNYWAQVQALAEARRQGADEALVCNAAGALVSAAMANVFLVRDGTIRTPAAVTGARRGVVRSWVLRREGVEESLLTPEDVAGADECFLTNSRLGVMPVTAIDGRSLPQREIGDRLAVSYREQFLGA